MRCRRVEQLLSAHLDGRLPHRHNIALAAHLDACAACRARRDEFATVGTTLRALYSFLHGEPTARGAREPASGLARRAIAGFAMGDVPCNAARGWRSPALRLITAGLAGAAIVAALVVWTGRHGPTRVARMALGPSVTKTGHRGQRLTDRRVSGRLKSPHERHEVGGPRFARFPRLRRESAKADFVPSLPRFQPTDLPARSGPLPPKSAAARRPAALPGDDFVSIPFPRIAAGGPAADRAAAQALAAYEREAAVVDARLAHKVSLAVKATALSDVCDRLRADAGISVTAGRSVADEKVTVFCREMPVRELMRQLSRPFGYTWLRSGKAGEYKYELVQDLRSQLLEEELRNRDRNAALLALDDEMNQYRKYLDLSPDEALAQSRTALPEERRRLERLATTGWGPSRMWFRLSPDDLARLRAGERVTYSAAPWADADEQPLAPDLARGGLQTMRDARVILRDDGFRVGDARSTPEGTPPAALPEARTKFTLQLDQSDLGQFTLVGGTGISISTRGHRHWIDENTLAIGESPAVRNPQNSIANAALARDPALRPRVTVRLPASDRSAAAADLSPSPSPARGGEKEGPVREPRVTSAEVLETLHRATGVNIVADYYTRLYPASAVAVANQPLFEALNHVADAMRLRWTKDGSWLRFRSTSFFNDRLKEVPNRLLAHWAAARQQHGTLTLDDLIEIAQLSDAQLDAGQMAEGARILFGLREWDLARNHGLRPHLRHLAGFTPPQRQEAMSPRGLAFRRMTLAQQQQFLALCFGSGRGQPQRVPLQPGLDELTEATLRLDYMLPGEFRWTAPDVPGAGTPPWLRLSPVREPTREAALQAARRIDPAATEAQIVPTELQLTVIYTPGGPGGRFTPGGISATPTRTSNSFAFRQRPL